MSGPLAGIRILEIGHMLAGPYCGQLLADLGADIVKIEPEEGDIARQVSPRVIGPHNEYFASLNRSKRSVVIDLASAAGQRSLHSLAAGARGLITNLRPSAIHKLGLTYDVLQHVNPALVCVALTGYGLNGSYASRPAYDYVIQAMTGVMEMTGEPNAPPTKTGYSAVDNSAGIMAAFGLVAQLLGGTGGQVDIAMYDVMLSQLNYVAAASLNGGAKAQRYPRSGHPYVVPAQVFETKSGWLVLFISHDQFWRSFCTELGRQEWADDPRFATMAARRDNRGELIAAVGDILMQKPAIEWAERLVALGVVAAAVASLEEALACDLVAERDMIVEIPTAERPLRVIGNPIKISGNRETYKAPPLLGEHTDALLGKTNG